MQFWKNISRANNRNHSKIKLFFEKKVFNKIIDDNKSFVKSKLYLDQS